MLGRMEFLILLSLVGVVCCQSPPTLDPPLSSQADCIHFYSVSDYRQAIENNCGQVQPREAMFNYDYVSSQHQLHSYGFQSSACLGRYGWLMAMTCHTLSSEWQIGGSGWSMPGPSSCPSTDDLHALSA